MDFEVRVAAATATAAAWEAVLADGAFPCSTVPLWQ
jgi:hypothetical protein